MSAAALLPLGVLQQAASSLHVKLASCIHYVQRSSLSTPVASYLHGPCTCTCASVSPKVLITITRQHSQSMADAARHRQDFQMRLAGGCGLAMVCASQNASALCRQNIISQGTILRHGREMGLTSSVCVHWSGGCFVIMSMVASCSQERHLPSPCVDATACE